MKADLVQQHAHHGHHTARHDNHAEWGAAELEQASIERRTMFLIISSVIIQDN